MGRKGVFNKLIEESATSDNEVTSENSAPSQGRVVDRMQSSLQDLQKAAAQDIPVDQIMESTIRDRINLVEGIEELKQSLHLYGQEVPIKVRVTSGNKPYEIVVGRRRLTAARALGWTSIRGFVVELDDRGLLKALNAENAGRLDTSFIGKAQMTHLAMQEGHVQVEVCELLGISQSLVSFMLRVYRGVGPEIIQAIGDAPGIGRNRWQTLQRLLESRKATPQEIINLMNDRMETYGVEVEETWKRLNAAGADTDVPMPASTQRFEVLMKVLKEKLGPFPSKGPALKAKSRVYLDGSAQSTRKAKEIVIKVNTSDPSAMLDFIEDRLPYWIKEFKS
jgi:ParB family chromosome partitioning protein